jgi:pyridoxal 4-dehydrogenase
MAKQVIVTGAGRGLGEAIVELLVDRGWIVWATDVNAEALTRSRAQHTAVLDVSDHDAVHEVLSRVAESGGIDGLVNNAAITPHAHWQSQDAKMWRAVFEVNVLGAWICSQTAAMHMMESDRGGSIVNLSSLTFYRGPANGVAYASSKGALLGMTRTLASAVGEFGIRVNCIAPGLTRTPGNLELVQLGELSEDRLGDHDPLRVLPGAMQPVGVAKATAFLLGEDSADITGQFLPVDGGTLYV